MAAKDDLAHDVRVGDVEYVRLERAALLRGGRPTEGSDELGEGLWAPLIPLLVLALLQSLLTLLRTSLHSV